MDKKQALETVRSRVRDFAAWLPDNASRQANPAPANKSSLNSQASFLRQTLPIIGRSDPAAWEVGGQKRVELDEAFAVLHLDPLIF